MDRRGLLIPAAGAGAFGFILTYLAPHSQLQAVALTLVVAIVALDSFRRAEGGLRPPKDAPILRSKVAHYVRISRVEDGTRLARAASNPFERALLRLPNWQAVTSSEATELGADASEDGETPPAPRPIRARRARR